MPTKQEHTNTAEVIRYRKRAQVAEQALTEAQTEINDLHQRLNDVIAENIDLRAALDSPVEDELPRDA